MSQRASDGAAGSKDGPSDGGLFGRPGNIDSADLLRPLILSAAIVILDQITKAIIVARVPLFYESGFMIEVIGDFLRIIHARNLGVAFSIGDGLPFWLRKVLFVAVPTAMLFLIFFTFYRSDELTQKQRWLVAAIIGGGVGNIIDRIFRPLGVVDFVDVRFYGLLGMERWPTFNVADAGVSVGGVLLILTMFFTRERQP